jgi:hypothetical protein
MVEKGKKLVEAQWIHNNYFRQFLH